MQSYGIDNSQISASSETSLERELYGKQSARLKDRYAWRAQDNPTKNEYLQIDLGQTKTVTAVATQGDKNGNAWVKSFEVKYSADNKTWNHAEVKVSITYLRYN